MANPVTCKITGLDELQSKLESLSENVALKGIRNALKEGGKVIQKQLENRSPDRSGFLRKHFNVKMSMKGKGDLAGAAYIGPDNAVYPKEMGKQMLSDLLHLKAKEQRAVLKAHKGRISVLSVCRFLEFGTSKMSKKPFMVAAFKSVGSKVMDVVVKSLQSAVEEKI